MLVGAKMHWSASTRAAMVRLALRSWIFSWRNLNQVVAAGPNMAVEHGKVDQPDVRRRCPK